MSRFRLGVAVAAWLIFVGALWGSNAQPEVVVLAGIIGVLAAAVFIAIDVSRATSSVVWAYAPQPPAVRVDDETVVEIAGVLRGSRRREASERRDMLAALIDDRLLDRHGIDRALEPEAADAVLGSDLSALLRSRRPRIAKSSDLHRLLDEIESI